MNACFTTPASVCLLLTLGMPPSAPCADSTDLLACSAVDGGQLPADADPSVAARRKHLESTGNAAPALPFGVTLLGPAWTDEFLWDVAAAFHVRLCRYHQSRHAQHSSLLSWLFTMR